MKDLTTYTHDTLFTLLKDDRPILDYDARHNFVISVDDLYRFQLEEFHRYIRTLEGNEYIVNGVSLPIEDVAEFIHLCMKFRLNFYEKFDCKHCTFYIGLNELFFDKDRILIVPKNKSLGINHVCNSIKFFEETPHYGTQYKLNNIYFNITLQERLEILTYIRANKGTYEAIH